MVEGKYHKNEIKVCSEPWADLAEAIIKQWIADGKPICDRLSINLWLDTLNYYYRLKRNKQTYTTGVDV